MQEFGLLEKLLDSIGTGAGAGGTLIALFIIYKIIDKIRPNRKNNPGKSGNDRIVEVLKEIKEETKCVKNEVVKSREKQSEDFSELSTDLKILLDRKR